MTATGGRDLIVEASARDSISLKTSTMEGDYWCVIIRFFSINHWQYFQFSYFTYLPLSSTSKISYLQGVPKKTLVSVQRLLEAFKNELQMKVG